MRRMDGKGRSYCNKHESIVAVSFRLIGEIGG